MFLSVPDELTTRSRGDNIQRGGHGQSVLEKVDRGTASRGRRGARIQADPLALNLTTLGIGAIIGAGLFSLTGEAAAKNAGPAVMLSFIIGGIACAFAGLCYAEMASTVPIAGSAYTYAYATMGEFIAWLIGWDLILEYSLGATTVAISWSGYVNSFLSRNLGIVIPPQWIASPGTKMINIPVADSDKLSLPSSGWMILTEELQEFLTKIKHLDLSTFSQSTGILNLPAMFIIAAATALLVIGIKESANVNNVIVVIKVLIVLAFIAFGIGKVSTVNWEGTFIPPNAGKFGHFGWSGVLNGAGLVFFAYIGFDAVSTASQEAKNPQRDMPIGILSSLAICTVLYILVAYVLTGVVSYKLLDVPDPIAVGIEAMKLKWLSPIIKLGTIAGLTSVILVMLLGQPRIFYSMSKDGLLPAAVSKLHPKFGTPYLTTLITGAVVMVAAGIMPLSIVGKLVSIGTLFAFAIVSREYLSCESPNPMFIARSKPPGSGSPHRLACSRPSASCSACLGPPGSDSSSGCSSELSSTSSSACTKASCKSTPKRCRRCPSTVDKSKCD